MGSLPQDLNETYDRILGKIDEIFLDDVKRFLQWLTFAACPLTLAELAEVIVVDFDSKDGPEIKSGRRYRDCQDVLDKCTSLVTESGGMVNYGITQPCC